MARLDVTEDLARRLAYEVGPAVETLTGWGLDLPGLGMTVVPRHRGYEEIVLARLRGMGISVNEYAPRNFVERVAEFMIEHCTGAAYEPSTQTLILVRENVDDSNLDGLRLVVAHELTHRGQHLAHPELFRRIDGIAHDLWASLTVARTNASYVRRKVGEIQSIMTMLESQAAWVQQVLHETRFPAAKIERRFGFAAILFTIFGGAKLAQYRKGVPQVAKAMAAGEMDELLRRL